MASASSTSAGTSVSSTSVGETTGEVDATTPTEDGGDRLDVANGTTDGCRIEWVGQECALDAPSASTIGGDTPLGAFDTAFGFFSANSFCGGCVEEPNVSYIHLVADPSAVDGLFMTEPPQDGLVLCSASRGTRRIPRSSPARSTRRATDGRWSVRSARTTARA